MKYILTLLFLVVCLNSFSQNTVDSSHQNPNFDSALAEKLHADDYGMKTYFFVILKSGSNNRLNQKEIDDSFKGHLENINRLVEQGYLVVAGPLGKNENQYRGIFIIQNVKTIKEVQDVLQTDPAIESGLLDYEIYPWYGSAALPEYLPYSDKIWKKKP